MNEIGLCAFVLAGTGAVALVVGLAMLMAHVWKWIMRPRSVCRDGWHGEHAEGGKNVNRW